METTKPTAILATFFVSTVAVTRTQEDGMEKRVKEQYALSATSFTDAESKTIENIGGPDLEVKDISIAPFKEAFLASGDMFYRVKVSFIAYDERTLKEKKQSACYLVQASSTNQAEKTTDAVLADTMQDYSIESIVETKIMEVFTE